MIKEYNALLSPFVNCLDYIFIDKYRQLFNEHIEQALNYIKNLKEEDFKAKVCLNFYCLKEFDVFFFLNFNSQQIQHLSYCQHYDEYVLLSRQIISNKLKSYILICYLKWLFHRISMLK